jgi:hypothetical protein
VTAKATETSANTTIRGTEPSGGTQAVGSNMAGQSVL